MGKPGPVLPPPTIIEITVNIPALSAYVDYLRGLQQQELDEMTAKLNQATERSLKATQLLRDAVS